MKQSHGYDPLTCLYSNILDLPVCFRITKSNSTLTSFLKCFYGTKKSRVHTCSGDKKSGQPGKNESWPCFKNDIDWSFLLTILFQLFCYQRDMSCLHQFPAGEIIATLGELTMVALCC